MSDTKRPANNWIVALKQWNDDQDGKYCIPKKGSKEYDEVIKIMDKLPKKKVVKKVVKKKVVKKVVKKEELP